MNEFATAITQALEAADIEWRSYSGRGMYGKACVGVSCGRNHTEEDVLEAVRDVPRGLKVTRDSLGMGTIVYWPAAQLDVNLDGTEKTS